MFAVFVLVCLDLLCFLLIVVCACLDCFGCWVLLFVILFLGFIVVVVCLFGFVCC